MSKDVEEQLNTSDPSCDIARKIKQVVSYLVDVVAQDCSLEKADEVMQQFLFLMYYERLKQNGLFAQDELLDLMRQAEIHVLGFSNLTVNNFDYFAVDDDQLDIDNNIITQVYS